MCELKTTKSLSDRWMEYDRTVGYFQLLNYGVIFLDEYNLPIDNENELEELYKQYQEAQA